MMRQLRKRILYLTVFNGLSYGQPIFIYIVDNREFMWDLSIE